MIKHANNGACPMCLAIINRYPGFNENAKSWIFSFQSKHKEFHISCAGRGMQDQEAAFARGASKAHWTESSHNWNAAFDTFVMIPGEKTIYPTSWYNNILAPQLPNWLVWYGAKGSAFYELPHIEMRDWRELAKQGILKLVE